MTQISAVLLRLPDERVVLQRRGASAPVSPNKNGFFGGHVEPGESFHEAAVRELGEETSLDVSKLKISHVMDYVITTEQGREVNFHLYEANIDSPNFDVFEGDGSITLTIAEALKRDDLTDSVRHALTELSKHKE